MDLQIHTLLEATSNTISKSTYKILEFVERNLVCQVFFRGLLCLVIVN